MAVWAMIVFYKSWHNVRNTRFSAGKVLGGAKLQAMIQRAAVQKCENKTGKATDETL